MDDYFLWLCKLVKAEDSNYLYLLNKLHSIEFYWTVDNDDNRAEDGKALRSKFISETGLEVYTDLDSQFLYRPCSVLEMLIALACRWENDVMVDIKEDTDASKWFWIMIDNLGFFREEFDDKHFDDRKSKEILKRVYNLLDRKYNADGFGGLFPLRNPLKDQTKVEIWYQINSYFNENYFGLEE